MQREGFRFIKHELTLTLFLGDLRRVNGSLGHDVAKFIGSIQLLGSRDLDTSQVDDLKTNSMALDPHPPLSQVSVDPRTRRVLFLPRTAA